MSFADLLKHANQGNANAQYKVGEHYFAFQDHTRAIKYYQLSAEQNHLEALKCVGCCYFYGRGVVQNYNKAFKYFLLSAEQKYPAECFNVAYCYEAGYGVQKDLKKALEYYYLHGESHYINECERLILKQFSETLNEADYVYAYPLYIKHNHKGLNKLKTLLNAEYVKKMHFMPSVLSDIVISFLL